MNASISILRPGSNNPATHPELTDTLRASVAAKASGARVSASSGTLSRPIEL